METEAIEKENKPLIHIEEYAAGEGVNRQTAERHVRHGKIQAIQQNGRTMIIDLPAAPEPVSTDKTEVPSGQIAKFDDNRWFELGALTVKARSGQTWKGSALVLIVLLVISIAAGVSAAGWFYINRQIALEQLAKVRFQMAVVSGQLVKEQAAGGQAMEKITALETELNQVRERLAEAGDIQLDLTKTISGHSKTITDQAEKIRELTKLATWLEKQINLTKAELQAAGKTTVSR